MKKLNKYTCASCSFECPNSIFTDSSYDIATEMGFERVSCKQCYYNDGLCSSCLFLGNDFDFCVSCINFKEVDN